jgi:hypothetical protein
VSAWPNQTTRETRNAYACTHVVLAEQWQLRRQASHSIRTHRPSLQTPTKPHSHRPLACARGAHMRSAADDAKKVKCPEAQCASVDRKVERHNNNMQGQECAAQYTCFAAQLASGPRRARVCACPERQAQECGRGERGRAPTRRIPIRYGRSGGHNTQQCQRGHACSVTQRRAGVWPGGRG